MASLSFLTVISLAAAVPASGQSGAQVPDDAGPAVEWARARERMNEFLGRENSAEAVLPATEALTLAEAAFGPDHPNTLRSVNELAVLYASLSRYAEAEPLFLRALAGRERVLPPGHHETLNSLAGLIALNGELGRTGEVERLSRRFQAASLRALESGDPGVVGAAPPAAPSRFVICPGDARCPRRGVDGEAAAETPSPE